MKKNGFTLIEILVTIALIAVLVLLVFPMVIGVFKTTKKRAFITDARSIFDIAKDENLIQDEIVNNGEFCYSNNSEYDNKLELIEKEGVYYSIKFNNNYVTRFEISTDEYYLNVEVPEGVASSDFKVEEILTKDEIGYKSISCMPQ